MDRDNGKPEKVLPDKMPGDDAPPERPADVPEDSIPIRVDDMLAAARAARNEALDRSDTLQAVVAKLQRDIVALTAENQRLTRVNEALRGELGDGEKVDDDVLQG